MCTMKKVKEFVRQCSMDNSNCGKDSSSMVASMDSIEKFVNTVLSTLAGLKWAKPLAMALVIWEQMIQKSSNAAILWVKQL